MDNMKIPNSVNIVLKEIIERLQTYFGKELIGIYLHGSLAMGGFNEISSDIDILIITENKLSLENKKDLSQIILKLSEKAPANGFELSVVALKNLKNFVYPTPYEFHFSIDHLQRFKEGKVDFTDGKTDPDLAAHFVITKERGVCLFGQPIAEIFPDVPRKYYLDSVTKDVEWSYERISEGADNGKLNVPVYGVLNFCRVIALINEGLITSKLEGGKWALKNLPEKYYLIIKEALKEKTQCGTAKRVEASLLKDFAGYSIRIIRGAK
ncbi:MAG: aminoglycoside adenylyltransferase domain-containing protein [Acidobacteriota bacterium]